MTIDGNRLDVLYAKLEHLKVSLEVLASDTSLSNEDRLMMLKALLDEAEAVTTEMADIFNKGALNVTSGC
jgi:hypothetical protein